MTAQGYKDLIVWQRALQMAIDVCREVKSMKNFALRDQITRSAISIPSNIAEWYNRGTSKEYIRFLNISQGSCSEFQTQMMIADAAQELNSEFCKKCIQEAEEIGRMLYALIQSESKNPQRGRSPND